MNDGTTLARVKAIIGDHAGLPADEVGDDTPLALSAPGVRQTIGFDSLERLELVVAFAEHFGIDIPDADADKPEMGTAKGIARYIHGRIGDDMASAQLRAVNEARTHSEHSAIDDEPAPLGVELTTGDPRFNPKSPVTINGYPFVPA
jgi:acyl carrier protein